MEAPKPKGFAKFDNLMRKLVKVKSVKSSTRFAVWRLYPDKPGCVDFLGSVTAPDRDEAEIIGRRQFGCEPSDELDVHLDDED